VGRGNDTRHAGKVNINSAPSAATKFEIPRGANLKNPNYCPFGGFLGSGYNVFEKNSGRRLRTLLPRWGVRNVKGLDRLIKRNYDIFMQIEFDSDKREWTLRERGLDFARAPEIFAGATATAKDERNDYGENRFVTVGTLDARTVIVVWTMRGEARRIISMRKANEREISRYSPLLG
jgi:uncharacterized DUF497 family protein